jgi:uncharacterized delta-60 repeat protein
MGVLPFHRRLRVEPLEARRLLAAGMLDPTFDSDGQLTTDFGASDDLGYSVGVQSDGKIVVAGSSYGDFALARYNANGTLDSSFSSTASSPPNSTRQP